LTNPQSKQGSSSTFFPLFLSKIPLPDHKPGHEKPAFGQNISLLFLLLHMPTLQAFFCYFTAGVDQRCEEEFD